MERLFKINEKIEREISIDEFLLSDNSSPSYSIIRSIIGTTILTNKLTDESLELEENHLASVYSFENNITLEKNIAEMFGEDVQTNDLKNYFFNPIFRNINKDFFYDLENEFCNFLVYQAKGSYTTAFVFLYRILELISYSFPLIYVSASNDFKHTYGQLKGIFQENKGSKTGELGFFKSALDVIFKDNSLLDSSIDIEFNSIETNNEVLYKSISSILKDEFIHPDTIEFEKISLKFNHVSSAIINVRNRFFHYFNRGDKNLASPDIIDSDYFFSHLNKPFFSWICTVFIEVNKHLFSHYIR